MKCKKCKRNMKRMQKGTVFYYQCPYCGYSVGKPTDANEESNTDSDNSSN